MALTVLACAATSTQSALPPPMPNRVLQGEAQVDTVMGCSMIRDCLTPKIWLVGLPEVTKSTEYETAGGS